MLRRCYAPSAALLTLLLVAGCGTSDVPAVSARPTAPLPPVEVETGVVHVHGLGVDPGDGTLYAATHSGLFRIPEKGPAERIANRAQDTMGFAVVGPGHFLGSGHPDPREDDVRPPLLGLLESEDAGRTWTRRSLHGEADFHALTAAHDQVYGYDSTSGLFMVSRDGQEWERRARLPLRSFAVDPDDAERVVGTVEQGLVSSVDGGRRWAPVPDAPRLQLLAWSGGAGLFGVDGAGVLSSSPDGGRSWVAVGDVGGPPEALAVDGQDPARLHVAVAGRGILVSEDGGATFRTRYTETAR